MLRLSAPCPSCDHVIDVPVGAVLLTTGYDDDQNARMAFICPRCVALVDQRVGPDSVALLRSGGCVPIFASTAEPT